MRIYDQLIHMYSSNDAHLKFSLPYSHSVLTEIKNYFKLLPS